MGQARSLIKNKSAGATEFCRMDIHMVQNILLIWLDSNIDESTVDFRNTMTQLRHVVSTIHTFTDGEQCIQFLKETNNDKICMIVSGSLGQHILPQVHDMVQIDSIFIFCRNKDYHEQWAKDWSKIKGVFVEILSICNALKNVTQDCEQNAISISFMAIDDDLNKNLDRLDSSFMYIQIMKEILLDMEFEQSDIQQYIKYCRTVFVGNESELKNIKDFEGKYRDRTPIWWYTLECFLYPMLNHALQIMDVDIIIKMGFFIRDLHRQIEQLHRKQFSDVNANKEFIVYRGQGMSKAEFEQMTKTKGGLISFNNFLSTSKNRSISLDFTRRTLANPDLLGVYFIMTIDPSQSTTPFAFIENVSAIPGEDEVLFAMQTVFRIGNITSLNDNPRLYQVELTLTSDNDKDLQQLTDYIRQETYPDSKGWYRLGEVLRKMGHFGKAEEVYRILLKEKTIENSKAPLYGQLGSAKYNQGQYKEAIKFYQKGLKIKQKTLPPNHPDLASSYCNIGLTYKSMGDYSNALLFLEKTLSIQQQSLPANHPNLASSYNNIGVVYKNMGEYAKALTYYEKALEIDKKSLPTNHPDLAYSYNNIGVVCYKMSDYSKALSYYEKALEIRQQSLPPNHPDLANSYHNLGQLHEDMRNYSEAYSFYERAVNIGQQSLSSDHPNLQKWKRHLEEIQKKF